MTIGLSTIPRGTFFRSPLPRSHGWLIVESEQTWRLLRITLDLIYPQVGLAIRRKNRPKIYCGWQSRTADEGHKPASASSAMSRKSAN
jgi:hypothetical protein